MPTIAAEPLTPDEPRDGDRPRLAPGIAVPDDIRAALTAEQARRLERLLSVRASRHTFAYRASSSVFGRAFYLSLSFGPEARSLRRLRAQGLRRPLLAVLADVALFCLAFSVALAAVVGLIAVSVHFTLVAFGIDMIAEGPAALHKLLYWW